MKKEYSPIVVIAVILLLLLFIILPPVFRKNFPKKVDVKPKNVVSILDCNRIYSTELFDVNVTARYINNKIILTSIKYTKIEVLPDDYQEKKSPVEISIGEEISYLSKLNSINSVIKGNVQTVTINNEVISNNVSDEKLKKYYNSNIYEEKKFFEEMGYSCYIQEG